MANRWWGLVRVHWNGNLGGDRSLYIDNFLIQETRVANVTPLMTRPNINLGLKMATNLNKLMWLIICPGTMKYNHSAHFHLLCCFVNS
jgi:hypothetical protein